MPLEPLPAISGPPEPAPIRGPDAGRPSLAASLAFGVALPVACLVFDPIVFRSPVGFGPILGDYKAVGYSATALGIASLATWLTLGRPAGILAGLLAAGAAFAVALGVLLLPLSLIGLMAGIGVLGFVPFGTGWVFARHAESAWRRAVGRSAARGWAAGGFLLAFGGPCVVQVGAAAVVRSAMAAAMSDDPAEAELGAARLARLWPLVDADVLAWAYDRTHDPVRKRRLADAYRRVTGADVEYRLQVLKD